MHVFSLLYRLLAVFTFALCAFAFADERQTGPESLQKLVTYRIYEDPNEPSGEITYEITLLLEEQDRHDEEISWSVERVTVRQPGVNGGADVVWVDLMPSVETESGDWKVAHADPDNPVNEDFVLPPRIFGTAVDEAVLVADLKYSFAGTSYSPSGSSPWVDTTTALDWLFTLDGETILLNEGEDEPVELPPVGDPPLGN